MIDAQFLDVVEYDEALELMHSLRDQRLKDQIPDTILYLQHPPVITMGRRPALEDLKLGVNEIKDRGISFIQTDRGGKLTYHGPGQLVIYFIFSLAKRKLAIDEMVFKVEEGLRLYLETLGIEALRDKKNPGLWLGNKKIAQLGLHVHKQITTHGAAVNINCDLQPFTYMIPCGIEGAMATSVLLETKKNGDLKNAAKNLHKIYLKVFDLSK